MIKHPNAGNIRTLLVFGLSIISICLNAAIAQTNTVRYEIVSHVKLKSKNPLFKMRIWLKDEPTRENVQRLCLAIKGIYKNENRIEVDVYSTREGAKKYVEVYEFAGPDNDSYYATLRGYYFINRKKGIEYLDFLDGPNISSKKMTHIDLTISGVAAK